MKRERTFDMKNEKKSLHILWTTADPHTSHHLVLMYATNALLNHWWDEVTVVAWGAAQQYIASDEAIRERMEIAKHAGVKFSACVSCAVNLGVQDKLEGCGVETVRWGELLSNILKDGRPLITV
jgi:hypothetical protein